MNVLLALAIAFAMGLFFSRLIRYIHLPNVTAYLLAGLVVGPYVLNVLTTEMNTQLSIISDVALGFIAYSIGGEFKMSYLKEIGIKPIIITLFEGCTAWFSLCCSSSGSRCLCAWHWAPLLPPQHLPQP